MAILENDTRTARRSMRARAFAFAAVALCLAAARASGATVSLSVSPAAAELGETVTLRISVDDHASAPRVSLPRNVRIVAGPSTNSRTLKDLTRGTDTRTTVFAYTLQIKAAGTYTLGPATARIGRRDVRSRTARLVVKKAGSRKDVRVFASIDPARAYAGKLVVATFEFAVAQGRQVNGYSLAIPFLAGIGGAEASDPEDLIERVRKRGRAGLQVLQVGKPRAQAVAKVSTRDIDGMPYEVYTVRRVILPSTPGLYDIGRASIVAAVVTGHRRVRDRFGRIREEPVTKRIALTSEPLSLQVLPPPTEGRPPGYSGAIGTYELSAEASPREVALGGEPVALTFTVRGEGNIETVPQPTLTDDSGWRVGSVEQKQKTGFEGGRPVGEKRFTIPLRPRSAEVTEIPAAELAVFDPVDEAYVTLRTEPIPVRVTVPEDSGALEGVALPEAARARMREREEVK
ncbi:MAG: BatD family protein, partial [Planctomycetota bacterium]